MTPIQHTLRHTFGFESFRGIQGDVVTSIMDKKDVLCVMPTSAGKSICFQIPALLKKGTTIVITPLISLMQDQVKNLREKRIAAACINSALSYEARQKLYRYLQSGKIKLLYISPELLVNAKFQQKIRNVNISMYVWDEVHCMADWGKQFRHAYLEAADKIKGSNVQKCAFTATATANMKTEIQSRLGLREPSLFQASFDRPKLHFEVFEKKDDELKQILEYVNTHRGCGIIYRTTRSLVNQTSTGLRRAGINAYSYHAGMTAFERAHIQKMFITKRIRIIVATIAFGMGIDHPEIRWILHGEISKNIEGYVQETGRAGRDNQHSICTLLYTPGDIGKLRSFIAKTSDPEVREDDLRKLREMAGYAESTACRRKTLLKYFAENYRKSNCQNCDVCRGKIVEIQKKVKPEPLFS